MKYRSPRQAQKYRQQRIPLVEEIMADDPVCIWPGCPARAVDVHEIVPRGRGGSITDRANCVPICRFHHSNIQQPGFKEIAEAYGLLKGSGSLRHVFLPDEIGFYCRVCALPAMNRNRHIQPGEAA